MRKRNCGGTEKVESLTKAWFNSDKDKKAVKKVNNFISFIKLNSFSQLTEESK